MSERSSELSFGDFHSWATLEGLNLLSRDIAKHHLPLYISNMVLAESVSREWTDYGGFATETRFSAERQLLRELTFDDLVNGVELPQAFTMSFYKEGCVGKIPPELSRHAEANKFALPSRLKKPLAFGYGLEFSFDDEGFSWEESRTYKLRPSPKMPQPVIRVGGVVIDEHIPMLSSDILAESTEGDERYSVYVARMKVGEAFRVAEFFVNPGKIPDFEIDPPE